MDVVISTAPWSGWVAGLFGLGLTCTSYFLYLLARQLRYRRPDGPGLRARVEGRLVGRAGALSFRTEAGELGRAEEVLLVEEDGRSVPVIAGAEARGLRAGSYLTVDGAPVTLLLEESLYRERSASSALLAGRLVVGRWPELRCLRVPVAIGCLLWLTGLACWLHGVPAGPSGRLFGHAPVEDVVPSRR